ncbi:heme-binding protein [Sphingomonas sp. LB3N6]|uniref:GlcG/HbpS family heme-binding protein n=1 Tax=Sphingomonas fucosidasi TaxID=3096164 RepID=UPI002FC69F3F
MIALTLATAARIVDAALAEGEARGAQPLCVVVLDAGAHVLALKRDERAGLLRAAIATAKASGALGMGMGSRALAARAKAAPAFFDALAVVSEGTLIPAPGGVLIRNHDREIIGAVGISGDTSDLDEACAVAAVAHAGLIADPGATPDPPLPNADSDKDPA